MSVIEVANNKNVSRDRKDFLMSEIAKGRFNHIQVCTFCQGFDCCPHFRCQPGMARCPK